MTNYDDKEILLTALKNLVGGVIALLVAFILCALCGCTKTQYIPIPEYHTETIMTDSTTFCSLLQTLRNIEQMKQTNSDSIIINLYERAKVNENGDTIGFESNTNTYKSTSREREYQRTIEILRDSVRELKAEKNVVKVDSVPVPYPVERELSRWEKAKMDLGGVAFGGLVVAAIVIAILALIARKRKK